MDTVFFYFLRSVKKMKKLSLVSISLFLLGLSFSVFAAKSKRVAFIKIEGGHIAAKGKLSIDLSKIAHDGYYQLYCNIKASDSALMYFEAGWPVYTRDELINGKATRGSVRLGTNVALDKGDNSFRANISASFNGGRLNILNLDDTVTAEVTHCSATPIEL